MVPDVGVGRNVPDIVPGWRDIGRAGVAVVRGQHQITRWASGFCAKCNESFYMITYAHAELHGYDSPDRMAREADFLMWNRHDTANYFIQRKKKEQPTVRTADCS